MDKFIVSLNHTALTMQMTLKRYMPTPLSMNPWDERTMDMVKSTNETTSASADIKSNWVSTISPTSVILCDDVHTPLFQFTLTKGCNGAIPDLDTVLDIVGGVGLSYGP